MILSQEGIDPTSTTLERSVYPNLSDQSGDPASFSLWFYRRPAVGRSITAGEVRPGGELSVMKFLRRRGTRRNKRKKSRRILREEMILVKCIVNVVVPTSGRRKSRGERPRERNLRFVGYLWVKTRRARVIYGMDVLQSSGEGFKDWLFVFFSYITTHTISQF